MGRKASGTRGRRLEQWREGVEASAIEQANQVRVWSLFCGLVKEGEEVMWGLMGMV